MWPDKRMIELFDIDLPIIQAPMAGSSSVEMAVAVSAVGGLGSLACALLSAEALDEMLTASRQRTERAMNINFFAHQTPEPKPQQDEAWLSCLSAYYHEAQIPLPEQLGIGPVRPFDHSHCAVLEAHRPKVASFHFGLPGANLIDRIKAAGVKVMSSATTVAEAVWLEAHGCDVVIAQGSEAGGHRGMFLSDDLQSQTGTLALVPQIADAVSVPIVAAGGIGDERGIAAAFALGASGVQLGTAYLLTDESTANALYRATLNSPKAKHTTLTNVISGRPTRCIANRMTKELAGVDVQTPAFPKGFGSSAPLRAFAESKGSNDFSAHYCGQAGAMARGGSAATLTLELANNAARHLSRLGGGDGERLSNKAA